MKRLAGGFILVLMFLVFTVGCFEQKFPHGQQVKPDNVEEKK